MADRWRNLEISIVLVHGDVQDPYDHAGYEALYDDLLAVQEKHGFDADLSARFVLAGDSA